MLEAATDADPAHRGSRRAQCPLAARDAGSLTIRRAGTGSRVALDDPEAKATLRLRDAASGVDGARLADEAQPGRRDARRWDELGGSGGDVGARRLGLDPQHASEGRRLASVLRARMGQRRPHGRDRLVGAGVHITSGGF
jgi:hypothetical protein